MTTKEHTARLARDCGDTFAFPLEGNLQHGMTLHEYTAVQAMAALMSSGVRYESAAEYAVLAADRLMIELVRPERKNATDPRD